MATPSHSAGDTMFLRGDMIGFEDSVSALSGNFLYQLGSSPFCEAALAFFREECHFKTFC
jgi:hypothetical protein